MTTGISPYSADQLKQIAAVLERTSPTIAVARDQLERQLLDLLHAVGTYSGAEEAALFREAGKDDLSDAQLAKVFWAIAASDDPFDPQLCSGVALSELNAAARARWARRIKNGLINRPHPLRDVTSDMLSAEDLAVVRELALELARYHLSFVLCQAPNKTDQDTLIDGLADIYIGFKGLNCHRYDLPHSVKSLFVQFAHLAMRSCFGLTEASKKAISNRWKRLKDRHFQGVAVPQS